jgi:iron complex outermembrane receptor protein
MCGAVTRLLFLVVVVHAQVAWAQPGAARGGQVTGRVIDEVTATPIAGAQVSVTGRAGEVRTDADGRFTLLGVATGTQTVLVTRDGYAPLTEAVESRDGQTATLEFRLPRQISFTEGLTVVGRISDYVDTSASAARTSAALLDIPQAIVVLPARLIEDIGALDTKDLYRFMSGVQDSPYSSTVVRGFTQREVLVNGAKGNPYGSLEGDVNNTGFSTSQFRLSNLERVEVLKGPASVLFGSAEPGGIINYVTKKPKERLESRVMVGTGQFAQALAEAEVTGPLTASRSVLARGAFYFEDRDSFRNNGNTRNAHLVGDLTWRPSPQTSVGIEYEYIDQRNDAHRLRGVPVTADGSWLAGYTWTATEPTDYTDLVAQVAQVRLDRRIGTALRLDSTFRWLSSDRDENYHEPRGITNGGTVMQREFRDQVRTNDDWSWNVNVNLPARLGPTTHDLSSGVEVVTQDFLFRYATARQQNAGGPVPPLALVDPVYRAVDPATYGLTPASYATDTATTRRLGVYAQDLIGLGARVNVLLGGRVDTYDDSGFSAGRDLEADQTAATGRVGVVYKVTPLVSVYGTTANGFTRAPILAQTPSANGPHDAETSVLFEGGVKSSWLSGRVQLTGAVYQVSKQNVLRPDPNFGPGGGNTNAVLAVGEIRNRGLEIDLTGAIRPWWNLAFNYAYLDSEIREDLNPALVGQPMPNAAPHAIGVFTRVDLPRGSAISGSVGYVGDRTEPFAGIQAPAYTAVDLQYTQQFTPRLRLLLRCENVFDVEYASSSLFAARAGNFPGQPRTVSVALTVTGR